MTGLITKRRAVIGGLVSALVIVTILGSLAVASSINHSDQVAREAKATAVRVLHEREAAEAKAAAEKKAAEEAAHKREVERAEARKKAAEAKAAKEVKEARESAQTARSEAQEASSRASQAQSEASEARANQYSYDGEGYLVGPGCSNNPRTPLHYC